MRKYLPRILLWLFVINLGTAFGAGIYESRVVVPQWQNTPPQTWLNTGLEFWVYVTTVPLTLGQTHQLLLRQSHMLDRDQGTATTTLVGWWRG